MSNQDLELFNKITFQYQFVDIEDPTIESIKEYVHYFLTTKASSYLKSELKHDDSVMLISIKLEKTKQWLYDWKFLFDIKNGRLPIIYETDISFKKLDDVVSHAFQHLKEDLSSEKKSK